MIKRSQALGFGLFWFYALFFVIVAASLMALPMTRPPHLLNALAWQALVWAPWALLISFLSRFWRRRPWSALRLFFNLAAFILVHDAFASLAEHVFAARFGPSSPLALMISRAPYDLAVAVGLAWVSHVLEFERLS